MPGDARVPGFPDRTASTMMSTVEIKVADTVSECEMIDEPTREVIA